ncbi:unnamed protein product [Caenorhabditis sp. 36 PRJEB53466]|nr:unnamed protein product [Caenorhabditis sp. 36 PRJEB53466]
MRLITSLLISTFLIFAIVLLQVHSRPAFKEVDYHLYEEDTSDVAVDTVFEYINATARLQRRFKKWIN